jgi:xanthine dehydrogenase accessory factor
MQSEGKIPVLADSEAASLEAYQPSVLVDARMRKIAPERLPFQAAFTIGLGPGFSAPEHCDAVIETNRGHHLGRMIRRGAAEADTSLPEQVLGQESPRVLRAPVQGKVSSLASIGDVLEVGDAIARVGNRLITAPFRGVLRGLIADGQNVPAGIKIGDLDPRADPTYAFEISDKALAIAGGVLEAILSSSVLFPRKSIHETD